MDSSGGQISHPARLWVDGALIAALEVMTTKMVLADVIEATVVVLGEYDLKYRQCPIAMDKWLKLSVVEHRVAPGLI